MHEPMTPPHPSSPTPSIDLTANNSPRSPYRGPLPPHMTKFHPTLRTPFSTAYRRIHSRRERIYSRTNPDLLAERLDISEETPYHSTFREKALVHISYAYACAGYAHATLCIIVSLALAALAFSFARGLYSDVVRKTRIRADEIAIQAAECYLSRVKNDCIMSEDGSAHHPTPALDSLCKKWVACERRGKHANTDAYSASIWAETAAETINSFAERINSTAVVISLLVVVIVMFVMSSAAFGFMHRRVAADTTRMDRSVTSEMLARDDMLRRERPAAITYGAQEADRRANATAR